MAEAGEIPGAVKIRGQWTFDVARLRAWLRDLEDEQCRNRSAATKASPRARPLATPTGFNKAVAGRSMIGFASAASSSDGRYEHAMSKLLESGSSRTPRG
jgi:hypothetical protein